MLNGRTPSSRIGLDSISDQLTHESQTKKYWNLQIAENQTRRIAIAKCDGGEDGNADQSD
jgi:hypothetical protein